MSKRGASGSGDEDSQPQKKPKLHPLFSKQPEMTSFRWKPSLGPMKTCINGVNHNPKATQKVAAFDLDGCIIESSFGTKASSTKGSPYKWWRPVVPKKLLEVHNEGYTIVMVTNQALRGNKAIANWKQKIPLIGAALKDVPFFLFAATARDIYRKPNPGMWYELESIFKKENTQIDKKLSFFVGDAAGRRGDFAGTDRKWALNLALPFFTPEEYFLGLPSAPYTLEGFHVSKLPSNVPLFTPSSTPIVPSHLSHPEIVVFVGYPSVGKSSFYRKHFLPKNYVHVNQDILKTRDKCIKAAQKAILDGQNCVIDNTNRDITTRRFYIDLARELKASIRCIHFLGSLELAWHNNLHRAFNMPLISPNEPQRSLLPYSAFSSFQQSYQEPQVEEGFAEVKRVNWTFTGTELERERWSMWLQIDGK